VPRHQTIRVPDEFLPTLVLLHGADACASARMPMRVHLPIKPASALQTPPPTTRPISRSSGLPRQRAHLPPIPTPHPFQDQTRRKRQQQEENISLGPASGIVV
jgi:hypothetical protein